MRRTIKEILTEINLFRGLNSQEISSISKIMNIVNVKEGEILVSQGAIASKFFIALTGSYLLYFKDGTSFILKDKGDFIGISTLIARSHYTASARALLNGELIFMKGSLFLRTIKQTPQIMNKIITNCKEQAKHRL